MKEFAPGKIFSFTLLSYVEQAFIFFLFCFQGILHILYSLVAYLSRSGTELIHSFDFRGEYCFFFKIKSNLFFKQGNVSNNFIFNSETSIVKINYWKMLMAFYQS